LPEAAQRVLSVTADDSCDARSLSEIIRRDASLAGRLLVIANSPLYAAPSPTTSLQQAVTRLGMRQVRDVVLMISMQSRLFAVPGFEHELREMFCHATATALFAQEIARMRRLNVEDAFLAGLFHDVGKPVVLQAIVDATGEAAEGIKTDRTATLELVEELHQLAGRALAGAWSLSASLSHVIEQHHNLDSTHPGVLMIRLADELALFAMGPQDADKSGLLAHPAAEALNLYSDDLSRLISRSATIAASAAAL
jgi:putative nucleotidyltransferase with HDIG domain